MIVVAGAAGFVGSHVMRLANARAIPTIALSRRDVPGMTRAPPFDALPDGSVLLHLAQESHRGTVNEYSAAECDREIAYARGLFDRYPHIVFVSTAALYGDRSPQAHREADEVAVGDRYAELKLATEQLALERGGTVVRMSNVYGPGQRLSSVVKDLIDRGRATGKVTTVVGAPVRDFIFVEDVAAALIAMARRPIPGIFNLGSGTGTAIAEVARMLGELMAIPVQVEWGSPDSPTSVSIVDPSLAQKTWKLPLPTPLRAGLSLTLGDHE